MGISNDFSLFYQQTTVTVNTANADKEGAKSSTKEGDAAVYEKSSATKNNNSPIDREKVQALLAETKKAEEQLIKVVQNSLTKQSSAYTASFGADFLSNALNLKNGGIQLTKDFMSKVAAYADKDTVDWAKEQVSEDGYYGVEKTSQRLVDFAKALSGGDPTKIDKMRAAIDKGFKEAERVWGDKLPEISQKTYDATMKKLDDWAASLTSNTSSNILNQASAGTIAK